MASTITLQQVIDWCRTQPGIKGQPLLNMLGITNEPGLSMCNNVIEELFCSPNNWRFNRRQLATGGGAGSTFRAAFTTNAFQQDYIISGATAEVTGKGIQPINSATSPGPGATWVGGIATIDTTDNGPHGFAAGDNVTITGVALAGYNGTFTITATPTPTTFTYTNGLALTPSGGPGVTDIGWLESCTFQDYANTSNVRPVHDVEVVFSIRPESIIQNPIQVCFLNENLVTNTVTIRVWPIPSSQIWGIQIPYQVKAPVFTDPSNTWFPWPDELQFILRQGVKWQAFLTASDPRADSEWQKFQGYIIKGLDIRQQEKRSESFFPDIPILRGG